jgi:hypothetical protein
MFSHVAHSSHIGRQHPKEHHMRKVATTYSEVLPGDEIDGETVIATDTYQGSVFPMIVLQFADLSWGVWTPAHTPVSVWR